MPSMSCTRPRIGWLAATVAAFAMLAAVGHVTRAQAATTCDLSKDGRKLGTSYVTSLKAQGTSCARAKKVVKAFNACRRASGGVKGRCTKRVLGYRCTETRMSIPTEFDAKATCKAGSRVVRFRYTQLT